MILRVLTRLLVLPSSSALRGTLSVILRRASDGSVLLCRTLALRMYGLLTGLLIIRLSRLTARLSLSAVLTVIVPLRRALLRTLRNRSLIPVRAVLSGSERSYHRAALQFRGILHLRRDTVLSR